MKSRLLFILFFSYGLFVFGQHTPHEPIGVQLYSFREHFKVDVRGTMQRIKDMGIKEVECAGFYGLTPAEFKKNLDEVGLTPIGTGVNFDELEDDVKLAESIKTAKILEAKFMVCFWIPHVEDGFTLEEAERAIRVFNKAGKKIMENKLTLLYHPHGYEFRPYKDRYLMDLIIEKTLPQNVSYEMDINWVFHAGHNPVTWLKRYPTRWKALHVKDRNTARRVINSVEWTLS
ncbi:MAG: TIM barrel protein [Saprospiraceae bacterium]|nr:TIM barrel protein [Saprospiraceae bacterium]